MQNGQQYHINRLSALLLYLLKKSTVELVEENNSSRVWRQRLVFPFAQIAFVHLQPICKVFQRDELADNNRAPKRFSVPVHVWRISVACVVYLVYSPLGSFHIHFQNAACFALAQLHSIAVVASSLWKWRKMVTSYYCPLMDSQFLTH